MKKLRITRLQIILPILAWGLIFLTLAISNFNQFQLQNIIGFLFLAIVPGLLTLIAARTSGLGFWGYITLMVAFSILELMIVVLLGNTFLPFAGIARPLDKPSLLLDIYLLISTLIAVVWLRVKEIEIRVKRLILFKDRKDFIISFIPTLFVVLAILGAISLNNGGSDIWTMVMLGTMGIYIVFLVSYVNKVDENVVPTAIFFMGLSLLLMTSLRGWYITGHDIQTEYKVFELTKNGGLWNMATYRDPYNACLSITILPTLLFNLLQIPDPYIFKVLLQIFFAFCPVLVYLIGLHWTKMRISLLGALYFISFPTFFTDMPFLTRQEIAFIFFGLMLYIIFNPKLKLSVRRGLFVLMGLGVILSHYATTYTVLLIFGLVVVSRPIFMWLIHRFGERGIFKNSSLLLRAQNEPSPRGNITLLMIVILFGMSFLWTSTITNTGGRVVGVVGETIAAIKNGFGGANRSIDATSLLTFTKPNQNQELNDYIKNFIGPIRAAAPKGEYFDEQTYAKYNFSALGDELVPLTKAGKLLELVGINVSLAMATFGQILAKLMEVLAPLGMIYLLFRSSIIRYMDQEIYLISLYCLIFIAMNIVLPVLSTEYGIFRAMQQSMFIMAPILVIATIMIGELLARPIKYFIKSSGNWGEIFAIILAVAFFAYSTSFIRQFFGGNVAELQLNNAGGYYDNYLIQPTEIYGVDWLNNIAGANADSANGVRLVIQADRLSKTTFASLTPVVPYNDIFPGVIRKDAYVFLNPSNVSKQRAAVIYNADQIIYPYPLQFLQDNKDLVYNNGGAEIYK